MDAINNAKKGYRRTELRRRQICEVSARLFAQHGYQATSLEMIAEELGYSRVSLYHYVKSKEEVIALLTENLIDKLREQVAASIPEDLPACEQLRRLIHTHVVTICSCPESKALLDFTPSGQTSIITRMPSVAVSRREYKDLVNGLICKGIEEGSFHVTDVKIATLMLLNAINHVPRWYRPEGDLTPEQIAERLAEMLLGALMNPCINQQ